MYVVITWFNHILMISHSDIYSFTQMLRRQEQVQDIQEEKTNDESELNDVDKMAAKIKQLEKMLCETVERTKKMEDVDMDKLFPKENVDDVEEYSSSSDEAKSTVSSVNTADDTPFLSKIGEHKFKQNGAILFLCQDSDEDNETWCDANKAVTNVGQKTFRKYVSDNNLKKASYAPTFGKTITKQQAKSSANKSKINAVDSKELIKITEKRTSQKGDMYKVIAKDLSEEWYTVTEIGSDYSRLLKEYEESVEQQVKKRKIRDEAKNNQAIPKRKTRKREVQPKPKQTNTKKKDSQKKIDKPPKKFFCRLNHRDYNSYKAEPSKTWFGENQRFDKSQCFICKRNIGTKQQPDCFVPTVTKPAYICVNSTKECKKCLCFHCCSFLMINDKSKEVKNNRRSTRKKK